MIEEGDIQVRRDICGDCPEQCPAFLSGRIAHDHPCAVCPDGRWDQLGARGACDGVIVNEVPLPPLLQRAVTFAKAAKLEAEAILHGDAPVTKEQADERLAICKTNRCGMFRSSDQTCGACGCPLKRATWTRSKECPRGLW